MLNWLRNNAKSSLRLAMLFLIAMFVIQLCSNLSRGYIFIPPLHLDQEATLKRFQSTIKLIAIEYPENFRAAFDLPQGDGLDTEAIADISIVGYQYPYIQIAYRDIQTASLDDVIIWGEQRITNPLKGSPPTAYETDSLEIIEINDKEAVLRNYHYVNYASDRINCIHVYLLDNRDGYVVEMCIDDERDSAEIRAVWGKMIATISLS